MHKGDKNYTNANTYKYDLEEYKFTRTVSKYIKNMLLSKCPVSDHAGILHAGSGVTYKYIMPPYRWRRVDGLVTNFHWPKSTLMLLVSAFYGRENVMAAYREAIAAKMRLFSYGDGMIIL